MASGLRIDERFASLIREIDRVSGELSSVSWLGFRVPDDPAIEQFFANHPGKP